MYEGDFELLKLRLEMLKPHIESQIVVVNSQTNQNFDSIKNSNVIIIQKNQEDLFTPVFEYLKNIKVDPFDIISFSHEHEFPEYNKIDLDKIKDDNRYVICNHKTYIWDFNYYVDLKMQGTKIVSMNFLLTLENKIKPLLNKKIIINDTTSIVTDNGFVILGGKKENNFIDNFLQRELLFPHPYTNDMLRIKCSSNSILRVKPKIILVNLDTANDDDYFKYDEIININLADITLPKSNLYETDNFHEDFFLNETKHKIKSLFPLDIDVIHFRYKNTLVIHVWKDIKHKPLSEIILKEKTLD